MLSLLQAQGVLSQGELTRNDNDEGQSTSAGFSRLPGTPPVHWQVYILHSDLVDPSRHSDAGRGLAKRPL